MKYLINFLWAILITFSVSAQKDKPPITQNTTLPKLLKYLEKTYDVKFSYNSKNVAKTKVELEEITLSSTLEYIEKQTSLIYKKINDRYYILKSKKQEKSLSICGYLVDDTTAQAISGAKIINKLTGLYITTDDEGFYELKNIHPLDLIEIQALGYINTEIKAEELYRNKCKKIWITPLNEELSEVVITEYLTKGVVREEGGAIKITPAALGILPRLVEPDPLQTIQFLPGIQSPTETASGLYIRSGTPDQNLVLWDGIKMYNTGHFFGLLSAFNPHIIDNVSVSRSGTHAKYGGRVGGVIDITSTEDIPQRINGSVGVNMTHFDTNMKIPINDKLGLVVSSRRAFTDVFETFTYNQLSERVFQNTRVILNNQVVDEDASQTKNLFYFLDSTVKGIYQQNESVKWVASALHTQNNLNFIADVGDIRDGIQDVLDISNNGLNLKRTQKINEKHFLDMRGYVSYYELGYVGLSKFSETQEQKIFKDNSVLDAGLGIDSKWNLTDENQFSLGYEFSSNEVSFLLGQNENEPIDVGVTANRSIANRTHAFYGEYKYHEKEAVKLSFGIRGNYFSELNRVSIEPRLRAEFDIIPKLTGRLTAERKEQIISQVLEFETRDFGLENQVWVLSGDDFIPIQKGEQFSGGISYSNFGWDIDVESYYKKTRGLTSFTRGFNTVLDEDLFVGQSEAAGIDILVKKRINNYRSWVSYSFARNTFKFGELNEGISFPGNFDVRHSMSFSNSYTLNNFEFSLGWNFRTGIPFTPAEGIEEIDGNSVIAYGEINSGRLGKYHRLDFSSSYNFNFKKNSNWKGEIAISVLNIYNRKNELSRTFEIGESENQDTDEIEIREVNLTSLGITPNLMLRVKF